MWGSISRVKPGAVGQSTSTSLSSAYAAYKKGNYDEAINILTKLNSTRATPENSYYLSLCHRAKKDYSKALASSQKALELAKKQKKPVLQIKILIGLAAIQHSQKKYPASINSCAKALGIAKTQRETLDMGLVADLHSQAAASRFELGKYDLALESYDKALNNARKHKKESVPILLFHKMKCQTKSGKTKEAAEIRTEIKEKHPGYFNKHVAKTEAEKVKLPPLAGGTIAPDSTPGKKAAEDASTRLDASDLYQIAIKRGLGSKFVEAMKDGKVTWAEAKTLGISEGSFKFFDAAGVENGATDGKITKEEVLKALKSVITNDIIRALMVRGKRAKDVAIAIARDFMNAKAIKWVSYEAATQEYADRYAGGIFDSKKGEFKILDWLNQGCNPKLREVAKLIIARQLGIAVSDIGSKHRLSLSQFTTLLYGLSIAAHSNNPAQYGLKGIEAAGKPKVDNENKILAWVTNASSKEVAEEAVDKSEDSDGGPSLASELSGKSEDERLALGLKWEKEAEAAAKRAKELMRDIKPFIEMTADGKSIKGDSSGRPKIKPRHKDDVEINRKVDEYTALIKNNKSKPTDVQAIFLKLAKSDKPKIRSQARIKLQKFDEVIKDDKAPELAKAEAYFGKVEQAVAIAKYIQRMDKSPQEKAELMKKFSEKLGGDNKESLEKAKGILAKLRKAPTALNDEERGRLYYLSARVAASDRKEQGNFYKYLKQAVALGNEKAKKILEKIGKDFLPGQLGFMAKLSEKGLDAAGFEKAYQAWIDKVRGSDTTITDDKKKKIRTFLKKQLKQSFFNAYNILRDKEGNRREAFESYKKTLFMIRKYKGMGGDEPIAVKVPAKGDKKEQTIQFTEKRIKGEIESLKILLRASGELTRTGKRKGGGKGKVQKGGGKGKGKGKIKKIPPSKPVNKKVWGLKQVKAEVGALKNLLETSNGGAAILRYKALMKKKLSVKPGERAKIEKYLKISTSDSKHTENAKKFVKSALKL